MRPLGNHDTATRIQKPGYKNRSGYRNQDKEARIQNPETEFKEFEPRIKFKPRLNYDWFNLKLYQMFQD